MSYGEIYKTTWWGNPTPEGWGNSYFDKYKYFKPSQITGLKLWSYAQVDPRPSWNVSGFQLNNEADATTNLKSKTGGYYVANFATGDYVDIPEITLTGDFSYHAFLEVSTSALAYGLLGNSANDEQGIFINTSNQVSVRIGSTTYAATSSTMSNGFHLVQIVRNGSNLLVYVDGVYIETLTVSTNDVVLNGVGIYNSLYFSTTIKDLSLFNTALTASQISNLYNNPQRFVELSREYGAERIYPFNQGNGEVGYPVWDLSGNNQHGTIQSVSAPAGTNFIYNDAEVGAQQVLESRNSYYWFDGVDDDVTLSSTIDYGTGDFDFIIKAKVFDDGIHFLNNSSSTSPRLIYQANGKITFQVASGLKGYTAITPDGLIHTYRFVRSGNDVTMYIDGVETETIVFQSSDSFYFNEIGGKFGGTSINNFNGIFISFEDLSHKIENHTGFQDSIGSITPTINGSPQQIFIPESTTKGIDLFGNTITNKWNQGLLNFTGLDKVDNPHAGVEIGDQISSLDVSNGFLICTSFIYNEAVDTAEQIYSNRIGGSGIMIYLSSTNRILGLVKNDVGSLDSIAIPTDSLVVGNTYFLALHIVGTNVDCYLSEINTDTTLTLNDTLTVNLESGSSQPVIGIRSSQNEYLHRLITAPIFYDKSSITLTEINNIRKYLKSLIS